MKTLGFSVMVRWLPKDTTLKTCDFYGSLSINQSINQSDSQPTNQLAIGKCVRVPIILSEYLDFIDG